MPWVLEAQRGRGGQEQQRHMAFQGAGGQQRGLRGVQEGGVQLGGQQPTAYGDNPDLYIYTIPTYLDYG